MNGKIKWIIIGIVIIAIIVVAGIFISNEVMISYKIEEIKDIKYNTLVHEEKYGVIDEKGNILVEPTYDAVQIPNPSKPVFICFGEYNK